MIQPLNTPEGRLAWRRAMQAHDEREAAEMHGLITGLAVGGDDRAPSAMLYTAFRELSGGEAPIGAATFEIVIGALRRELDAEAFDFMLYLPPDDAPRAARAAALASWCAGLLAGLAHNPAICALPEGEEILPDLAAITQATSASNDEDDDEEEAALMELVEYVRGAVLLLRQAARLRPDLTAGRA